MTLKRAYINKQVFRHNSFFGYIRMAQMNMGSIIYSETTTTDTKDTARRIIIELETLKRELKTRIDPPSAFK